MWPSGCGFFHRDCHVIVRFFVGTTESTFSFRIREDRQFMRFSVESTFNQLCGSENNETDPHSCPPPTKWLLVEDKNAKGVHSEL